MADNSNMSSFEGLQCIWMKSGLVEYKLCDHNFDCDICYFHSVMRNKQAVTADPKYNYVNDLLKRIDSAPKERNLIYVNGGFVLKKLFNDTYFIGLSALITDLLKIESVVIVDSHRKQYEEGAPFLVVSGSWGTKVITAPFRFLMLDLNTSNGPFKPGSKWVGMIEVKDEILDSHIKTDEDYKKMNETIRKIIVEEIHTEHYAGSTMHDGGVHITSLDRLLGKESFNKLLMLLF